MIAEVVSVALTVIMTTITCTVTLSMMKMAIIVMTMARTSMKDDAVVRSLWLLWKETSEWKWIKHLMSSQQSKHLFSLLKNQVMYLISNLTWRQVHCALHIQNVKFIIFSFLISRRNIHIRWKCKRTSVCNQISHVLLRESVYSEKYKSKTNTTEMIIFYICENVQCCSWPESMATRNYTLLETWRDIVSVVLRISNCVEYILC